ncbi:hypothetical protein KIN20_030350 [Parelaphostrongylus tenuis]|uniref:Uncharacterized protein n=1 Tax=Parelaphostrongylus tenuis TaxID=148309 RepID=A0AAD5R3Z0_PARTN|nr:hypothetical protein KIN20_030350 [Parelaphostrongylus tenuis]
MVQRVLKYEKKLQKSRKWSRSASSSPNTVTGICISTHQDMAKCDGSAPQMATIAAINATQLTIMGTVSTTNIIMANWSRMMWQNVVNRAVRMLATGPFRSHFFSAFATVNGKLK